MSDEGTDGREASESAAITPEQLKARLRRIEILRGASRAIAPSMAGASMSPPFEGAEVASAIQALLPRLEAAQTNPEEARNVTAELGRLDETLVDESRALRTLVDAVPLVQFRATLPGIAARRRFDVVALLDLLVQDQGNLVERWVLFDYLITLLATEEVDGRRVVTSDPVALTPRLRLLCERAESVHGAEAAGVEQEFYAVAAPYGEYGDTDLLLARMRRRKRGLGPIAFVPGVLRAVVTYNASVANLIEKQLVEATTQSDDDLLAFEAEDLDEFNLSEAAEVSHDGADSGADAEDAGSIFDSRGLSHIVDAVRRRCRAEELGTSPAERIAARLDLDYLEEAELESLVASDEGESRVIALAVTVGLVIQKALESTLDLRDLELDPDWVQEAWPQELDSVLKELISEKVAGDAYQEACALSELQTRFLYESISSVYRRNRQSSKKSSGGSSGGPQHPASSGSTYRVNSAEVREIAAKLGEQRAREVENRHSDDKSFLRRRKPELLAAASMLCFALAFTNLVHTPRGDVDHLSASKLAGISDHLSAGYRNGNGQGTLFVGTLAPSWKELDERERYAAAEEMVRMMTQRGAREVLVFDSIRKMHVQATNGKIRLPRKPPDIQD